MSQQVRNADAMGTGKASGSSAHSEGGGTATGSASHAEGASTTASGTNAHSEGSSTSATGSDSHAEGSSTTAGGTSSHAEGRQCSASAVYAHAEGQLASATRHAQHAKASGNFASGGDAQYSNYVQMTSTTDATPTVLTSAGVAIATSGTGTNVVTLPTARALFFRAEVAARRTDLAGDSAGFVLTGLTTRDATGAARLVGAPTVVGWADAGAAAWTVTASIATYTGPNYYLAFTATGEAGKTIRWVATVHTTEAG